MTEKIKNFKSTSSKFTTEMFTPWQNNSAKTQKLEILLLTPRRHCSLQIILIGH